MLQQTPEFFNILVSPTPAHLNLRFGDSASWRS